MNRKTKNARKRYQAQSNLGTISKYLWYSIAHNVRVAVRYSHPEWIADDAISEFDKKAIRVTLSNKGVA